MKILTIVHNHSSFAPGGTEVFAEGLHRFYASCDDISESRVLAAADPTFLQAKPGTSIQASPHDDSVFFFRAPGFNVMEQSRTSLEPLLYDFTWFLQDYAPDIIHIQHLNHFGVETLAVIRKILPDVKIIMTLHEYYLICAHDGMLFKTNGNRCQNPTPYDCASCFPEASSAFFATRALYIRNHLQLVDKLVSPSDFLRHRFLDWGIVEDKITTIRNGWSVTHPDQEGQHDSKRFVLLGNLRKTKGSALLLEAFCEALKREECPEGIVLDVYGEPNFQPDEFKQDLKHLVKKADGAIRLHGGYKVEDLPHILHGAGWVTAPSIWWENAPLVINEAFSMNCPVLCSDIGGMAESVRDGIDGIHVRVGDVKAWADTIVHAAGNDDLLTQLQSNILPVRTLETAGADYMALIRTL